VATIPQSGSQIRQNVAFCSSSVIRRGRAYTGTTAAGGPRGRRLALVG
jgi:hypothetical protein